MSKLFPSCSNKRNPEGTHQQPDRRHKWWVLFGLPVSKLLMVHAERFTQIQAFYGPACLPLVWPDPFPSLPLPGEPLTTGCQLLHCFSNFWKIYLGMILSAETGPHSQDSESPSVEWAQEPAFLIHSWVALEVLA